MATKRRRRLDEDIKGAGHQMDRIDGDSGSVFKKDTDTWDVGKTDVSMKGVGKEWPRDHNETAAMCDVDEDGTEHEPQGVHNSEHGEASDGITTKSGHDWPTPAKNIGGSSEPFGNKHRTDDGLQGGDIEAFQPPKGTALNTSNVETNSKSTSEWTIASIDGLMNESGYDDEQLQSLFDAFAREHNIVCLEDFTELLYANGIDNLIDEAGFMNLLANNAEFTFHEQEDMRGKYWLAEGLPAALKAHQFKKGGKKGSDDESEDEDDSKDSKSKDGKPAFLKDKIDEGLPAFLKDKQKDDEDDDEEEIDECDKPKKPWKKKAVKEWIELARKVYATEQKGRITKKDAGRALHISLNCSLDREAIRGAVKEDRTQINKIAKYYGIKFDEAIQRIVEGPFDLGGPAGPAGPSARGQMGLDPHDPNELGMADDQEMVGGSPGELDAAAPGLGVGPGLGGEHMSGPAGNAGLGDPSVGGDLGGPLGGDLGTDPGLAGDLGGQYGVDAGGPMGDNIGLGAGAGIDDWATPGGGEPGLGGDTAAMDLGEPGLGGIGDEESLGAAPMGRPGLARPRGRFESRHYSGPITAEDYPTGNGLEGGTWKGGIKGAGHEMDHAGDASENGAVAGKGKAKKTRDLPQDDTDTVEIKPKDLLGAGQKNTIKPSQEFENGGCGKLSGSDGLKENLNRIGRFVQRYLAEHDHGLRGKFALAFNAKVNGKRVSSKNSLPDIIADAEELMLIHGSGSVMLEAVYSDVRTNKMLKRVDIKLPVVKPRNPMMQESKVLFRFDRHAERFADFVMAEGDSCRLTSHNFGAAVHTKLPLKRINKIFAAIIK